MLVVKPVSEVGRLRGSNCNGHGYGELQDEVEGGQDMSNLRAELVGTEGDQEDDADEEGQSSSNNDKCTELIEISVRVVSVSDEDDAWIVIPLEILMTSADD